MYFIRCLSPSTPGESAYVDPDLLVAAAIALSVLAFLAAFLSEAFAFVAILVTLGAGVFAVGLLGRQRDGLLRAVFVGMAPASGVSLAILLHQSDSFRGLTHHVGMGVTTGLLLAFFGYVVGTLEYWLADETPSPRRRDLARFAVLVVGGLVLAVGARLYAEAVAPSSIPGADLR